MGYSSPFDSNCIIPGFMLRTNGGGTPYEILEHSCSFSGIGRPEIIIENFSNRSLV